MANFNYSEEVDTVNFDFRPALDLFGVVPEPSDKAIDKFRAKLIKIVEPITAKTDGKLDAESLKVIAASMTEDEKDNALGIQDQLLRAIAELCGNTPPYTAVKKLPFRGQKAWIGYIMGTFINPKV